MWDTFYDMHLNIAHLNTLDAALVYLIKLFIIVSVILEGCILVVVWWCLRVDIAIRPQTILSFIILYFILEYYSQD